MPRMSRIHLKDAIDTLTLPTVHLNGTSRKMLADGYHEAHRKALDLLEAFGSIEHNARDYYVQSPNAYSKSRAERDTQLDNIRGLITYLEAHLIHLGT